MLCLLHIKSNKVDILYEIKMKPSAKVDKSLVHRCLLTTGLYDIPLFQYLSQYTKINTQITFYFGS